MDGSLPGSLCPSDSPGENTGVGYHALLLGIFPTQGWNLRFLYFLHWQEGCLLLLLLLLLFLPLVPPGKPQRNNKMYVTEQDSMGLTWTDPSPISSTLVPLLSLDNSIWCTFTELFAAAAAAKSLQSCPTLCDPTDGSPPGSPIPGILQARTLEWVAISFPNA